MKYITYCNNHFLNIVTFFWHLKVKGDNYRRTKEGNAGNYTFEVGFDLFSKNPKGNTYKMLDEWWLVDSGDVVSELPDPTIVKVTSKRYNFVWPEGCLY